MTEAQLQAHQAKRVNGRNAPKKPMTAKASMQQLGRLKVGQMNKTEAAYQERLEWLKNTGKVLWFKFEGMKFRLADKTFYTPDFAVMNEFGEIEIHEVKGHWVDDARVKIKVAASMYPMKFIAVKRQSKKDGGGWSFEEF